MTKAFDVTEYIDRPPADVFAVLSNPTRGPEFLPNIKDCTQLTEGPIREGTRFRETRVINGREATAELEVITYHPNSSVRIGSEAGGIDVAYRYDLSSEGTGTRLTWTGELTASGLRRLLLPMITSILKKEDGDHLQKLKAFLEADR